MGRLKRKKTSYKRKKRKESTGIGVSSQKLGDTIAKKATLLPESSNDTKQIQTSVQKKPLSGLVPVTDRLKKGFIEKGLQFLREVKVELKKVTWPSRKQAMGSTLVVIILVMIVSLFLGIVDIGLSSLIRVVLQ